MTFMDALKQIIMTDDFVARRRMLDDWQKKYLATAHVEMEFKWATEEKRKEEREGLRELAREMLLEGLREDPGVLVWQEDEERLLCEMIAVRRFV